MSSHTRTLRLPSPESHHLVRERNFNTCMDLETILALLHLEGATGQLSVNMTQGSVGSITFREQHRVFPDKDSA
jgi:hypothetical protein